MNTQAQLHVRGHRIDGPDSDWISWATAPGLPIPTVEASSGSKRYEFKDGSALVELSNYWDYGFSADECKDKNNIDMVGEDIRYIGRGSTAGSR